jgi:hypothetical protein
LKTGNSSVIFKPWTYSLRYKPLVWRKITGAPKANVVVPVGRRVVQVEVKRTCIAVVVPIAAADETPRF